MKKADKVIRTIATYLDYASCVFLFIMMAFVTVYVLVRAVFGYAIFGTYEVVQLCSLLVVSLSLMHNEYESGNITIDFLDNFVGKAGKKVLMLFSLLVSAGISGICTYRMYNFMLAKFRDASVTANLAIPVYVFLLIMFLSLLLLTVCILFKFVAQIVGYKLGSDLEADADDEMAAS